MAQQSDFVRNALVDLHARALSAAELHPGLRHMLVLPPGECIRIPTIPGVRPLGSMGKQKKTQDMHI